MKTSLVKWLLCLGGSSREQSHFLDGNEQNHAGRMVGGSFRDLDQKGRSGDWGAWEQQHPLPPQKGPLPGFPTRSGFAMK